MNLLTVIQTNQRLFSEEGLLQYDGSDPKKPIYLAVWIYLQDVFWVY